MSISLIKGKGLTFAIVQTSSENLDDTFCDIAIGHFLLQTQSKFPFPVKSSVNFISDMHNVISFYNTAWTVKIFCKN